MWALGTRQVEIMHGGSGTSCSEEMGCLPASIETIGTTSSMADKVGTDDSRAVALSLTSSILSLQSPVKFSFSRMGLMSNAWIVELASPVHSTSFATSKVITVTGFCFFLLSLLLSMNLTSSSGIGILNRKTGSSLTGCVLKENKLIPPIWSPVTRIGYSPKNVKEVTRALSDLWIGWHRSSPPPISMLHMYKFPSVAEIASLWYFEP
mmetsp:Transcript_25170/g.49540  ORF Transcript_25170/g.49540 Transcript_25170/m.49540 type:complete len:208 (+) Transcript_25170:1521-2144(+)